MTTDPFIQIAIGENCIIKEPVSYVCSPGVEPGLRDDAQCKQLMQDFIAQQPALWNEDIGE